MKCQGRTLKIVGVGAGFRFGDDGNPGADGVLAPFFGVTFGGTNQGVIEAKHL